MNIKIDLCWKKKKNKEKTHTCEAHTTRTTIIPYLIAAPVFVPLFP